MEEEDESVPVAIENHSNYSRLVRVIAYCIKFRDVLKQRVRLRRAGGGHRPGPDADRSLTRDLRTAETDIIKVVQRQPFKREVTGLREGKKIPCTSALCSLDPLLDDTGLLRVGGRLAFADLGYEQRHAIILAKVGHVTKLIIQREHVRILHAGSESVLSAIRQKYWLFFARNLIKGIIRKCMRCNRVSPRSSSYLMEQLPLVRVNTQGPFLNANH